MHQASDERFRSFFEYAPFGICVCARDGRIVNVNAAFCRMLGYLEQEPLLGTSWATLICPDDLPAAQIRRDRLWAGMVEWIDAEVRWLHLTGTVVWTRLRVSMIRENGDPVYSVLHVEDITERKRIEDALRESEDRFRIMADGCPTVLWVTDPEGGNQFVNRAYREFGGTTYEELEGEKWQLRIHPDDSAQYIREFHRAVREHVSFRAEARVRNAKGEWRYLESHGEPRFSAGGEYLGHVGLSADITERKQSELRLSHQALHDELTGLPNRRLFRERLAQAIAECRAGECGAVFFIDLDQFKLVNDTLGHSAGDHLIREVASRLLQVFGGSTTLARFGGDEFTLLATGLKGMDSVRDLGNELIRCMDTPFLIEGREVFIGASIGIGVFPENGTEPYALKEAANLAMHEAKRAGKNQLQFYTPELADAARERLDVETRLRQAFAFSEFQLKFQPQFAPGRPRPTRFEALIFWAPQDDQAIAPLKFIPIAEQNGLIVPIGTWVLREACRQCAVWQAGDLCGTGVSVNVSAAQFACPDFADIVVQTLESTGLPAHLLELELTESVFIKDVRESARSLTKLRNLGVTIALDDFGTGYSSLSYLQELPLDALKIDRSFLTESESRPHGAAVLRCLVELAHTLGLRVIAEGVETRAQLDFLVGLGCDEMQGFLLGEPAFHVAGEVNRRD